MVSRSALRLLESFEPYSALHLESHPNGCHPFERLMNIWFGYPCLGVPDTAGVPGTTTEAVIPDFRRRELPPLDPLGSLRRLESFEPYSEARELRELLQRLQDHQNFESRFAMIQSLIRYVQMSSRRVRYVQMPSRRKIQSCVAVGVPYESVRQGPQRGSRPKFVDFLEDVYSRPGIRSYAVNIRPAGNFRTIRLGVFNTAREAGCARDAWAFYSGQTFEYNYPQLEGSFPRLPSHLRVNCVEHHEEIMKFVKKQALEAARRLTDHEKSGGDSVKRQKTLYPVDHVMDIMQIENVDTKIAPTDPAALPILASNTLGALLLSWENPEQDNRPRSSYGRVPEQHSYTIGDSAGEQSLDQHSGGSSFGRHAKTEGTDYLVGADMFEGDSTCQEADGNEAYGWLKDMESEDEGSATHDSQTEVTENSPSHEINPHFAGRKRKSMNDELSDDIIAKLAPFIKKQIEEALNFALLPLVSVLRSREEDEQKHREQMLALEKEKLALKREKLLFKRRRDARL